MDMATHLTAADQLTAAIMAVYDFYHCAFITEAYGGIVSERWSQVKKLFAFHRAAFILTISSDFIDCNWVPTSAVMNYILLRCKLKTWDPFHNIPSHLVVIKHMAGFNLTPTAAEMLLQYI